MAQIGSNKSARERDGRVNEFKAGLVNHNDHTTMGVRGLGGRMEEVVSEVIALKQSR